MRIVFIDTSAFYALFNRDDIHHKEAAAFYQDPSHFFVTTGVVFIELLSLLTKRQGKQKAIHVGKEIKASKERLKMIHMNDTQVEKAWELFCRFKDKEYDVVDCLSFICMNEENLNEAFAFDHHFEQYGFKLCPSDS